MKRNTFIRYWVEYQYKDGTVTGKWFSDLASANHFIQRERVKVTRWVKM